MDSMPRAMMLRNLLVGMLASALLGACGILGSRQAQTPAETAAVSLTMEAEFALALAEADAKAARTAFTLWVPAENALKRAREAAQRLDSATVIKEAGIVSDLCKISARQANYPSTER